MSSETTGIRRAAPSDRLQVATDRIERPRHIPAAWDPRLLSICDRSSALLAAFMDNASDPTPAEARWILPRWACCVGHFLEDSSQTNLLRAALRTPHPVVLSGINAWFAGRWSTRDSLVELCFRAELGERTAGAALWLFEQGEA